LEIFLPRHNVHVWEFDAFGDKIEQRVQAELLCRHRFFRAQDRSVDGPGFQRHQAGLGAADLENRHMAAYLEAIRFFKTHKEEAVRKMMVLSRLNDREIAEKAFDVYTRSLPDDGRPTIKGLETVLADFAREDPRAKGLTVAQIVDLSFLP
jgi:hypothetical protein